MSKWDCEKGGRVLQDSREEWLSFKNSSLHRSSGNRSSSGGGCGGYETWLITEINNGTGGGDSQHWRGGRQNAELREWRSFTDSKSQCYTTECWYIWSRILAGKTVSVSKSSYQFPRRRDTTSLEYNNSNNKSQVSVLVELTLTLNCDIYHSREVRAFIRGTKVYRELKLFRNMAAQISQRFTEVGKN